MLLNWHICLPPQEQKAYQRRMGLWTDRLSARMTSQEQLCLSKSHTASCTMTATFHDTYTTNSTCFLKQWCEHSQLWVLERTIHSITQCLASLLLHECLILAAGSTTRRRLHTLKICMTGVAMPSPPRQLCPLHQYINVVPQHTTMQTEVRTISLSTAWAIILGMVGQIHASVQTMVCLS